MKKIKVLIVEDSAFMRKLISDFLNEDPRIDVMGTARNGEDALLKIKTMKPDVVTLDIEMPIMNGLEALKRIMNECPTPVVMLSSTTLEGAENTLRAMQYGAFDFIAKPSGAISLDLHRIKEELKEKVVEASKTSVHKLQKNSIIGKTTLSEAKGYSKIEPKNRNISVPYSWNSASKKLICIGTSTGGPRALQYVLTTFPKTIDAPILVVQHMPPGFTKSLASRLDTICDVHVKEAEEGEIIQKGTVYIAPGGYHLKVRKVGSSLAIRLDQTPQKNGHRPSVDVMFESVSELSDYSVIAVIMTGMGTDGAKGLIELKKNRNTVCIAESQETSIVFGMPKAAIATNMVDIIERVEHIGEAILKYC